jgi:hypothetical protein
MTDYDEEGDETIYEEAGREDLVESDEMSPAEEAFMKGYEDADSEIDEVDAESEEEIEE